MPIDQSETRHLFLRGLAADDFAKIASLLDPVDLDGLRVELALERQISQTAACIRSDSLCGAATMSARTAARNVRLKRAYGPAASKDGARILVDRLWPRGVTKEGAALDKWMEVGDGQLVRAITAGSRLCGNERSPKLAVRAA